MGDVDHCAGVCRNWALATWRALSPARSSLLLRIASSGPIRVRASIVWAERAGLVFCGPRPELTPLGSLVAAVGAAEIARGA